MKHLYLIIFTFLAFISEVRADNYYENETAKESSFRDLVILDNSSVIITHLNLDETTGFENAKNYKLRDLWIGKNAVLYTIGVTTINADNVFLNEWSRIQTLGSNINIFAKKYDGAAKVESLDDVKARKDKTEEEGGNYRSSLGTIDTRHLPKSHVGATGWTGGQGANGEQSSRWNFPNDTLPSREQYIESERIWIQNINGLAWDQGKINSAGSVYDALRYNLSNVAGGGRFRASDSFYSERNLENGAAARSASDGLVGNVGFRGWEGQSAGNITLDVIEFNGGAFVAIGGSGGQGGEGGRGGKGGPNDSERPFAIYPYKATQLTINGEEIQHAEKYVNGDAIRRHYKANPRIWLPGLGGKGGLGGDGGAGGNGGKIVIRARSTTAKNNEVPLISFNSGGYGGLGGSEGNVGELGDLGWIKIDTYPFSYLSENGYFPDDYRIYFGGAENKYKQIPAKFSDDFGTSGGELEFVLKSESEMPWPFIEID